VASKFYKNVDPSRQAAFLDRDEHRRVANRSIGDDPILVCEQCGWKIRESARKAQGLTACARCHGTACRVHNLDYDLNIRPPARPDVNTILAQEQQMMRRMGRK